MKTAGCIAILAIVLASLGGCASQKFESMGTIRVGDAEYTELLAERVNPWGTNLASMHLVESDVGPRMQYYAPPCPPQQPRYAQGQLSEEGMQYEIEMLKLQLKYQRKAEEDRRERCPPPPPPPPPPLPQSQPAQQSMNISTLAQAVQVNQTVNVTVGTEQ